MRAEQQMQAAVPAPLAKGQAQNLADLLALQTQRQGKAAALTHKKDGRWEDASWGSIQDEVKKVSAGLINSVNYVHMREWLQRNGVDPTSVQFLELPFPQMADALFQNRLDAVWNVEPFVTIMLKTGKARTVVYPYQENIPNMDITAFYARESWLKANRDVALRFKRAIEKATK